MVKRGLVIVSLAGLAVVVVRTVGPDVKRYVRISRM
jgi:hypothetical protein